MSNRRQIADTSKLAGFCFRPLTTNFAAFLWFEHPYKQARSHPQSSSQSPNPNSRISFLPANLPVIRFLSLTKDDIDSFKRQQMRENSLLRLKFGNQRKMLCRSDIHLEAIFSIMIRFCAIMDKIRINQLLIIFTTV